MSGRWQGWRRAGVVLALALMVGSGLSVGLPGQHQPAAAAAGKSVKLAWFSSDPKDGTTAAELAPVISHTFLGAMDFGDALKAAGYTGEVEQYKLAADVEGPGPYKNASASCNSSYAPLNNQIVNKTGEFCKYIHPNESWFLHNGKGERLIGVWNGRYMYHMNPGNAGWQAFALQRLQSAVAPSDVDGIHLDNVELSPSKAQKQLSNSDGVIKEYGTAAAFQGAWVSYLKALQPVRSQGTLAANFINDANTGTTWEAYLPYVDGGMVEAFATGYSGMSATAWNNQLKQYESALKQGKSVVALSQGAQSDTTKQTFALASYLLITDGQHAYFRYSNSSSYGKWWWYDNYNVALGQPKGARYQSGSSWRRDFECGYVTVNPDDQTGKIVTQSCSSTAPSTSVSVSLKNLSDGQTVSGKIAVEAVPSTGVDKVDFYLDGTLIETEQQSPYYLGGDNNGTPNGFDTKQWSDGSHTLKAVATTDSGQTGSKQISFTVQNAGASLSLKGISSGQTVDGMIGIEAVPTVSVTKVDFYLDGKLIETEKHEPYYLGGDSNGAANGFDTHQWASGDHTLKAVATDGGGKTFSAQVSLTVQNASGPYITLVGLYGGQTIAGKLAVQAVPSVSVVKVNFYLDGNLVGSEKQSPYYLGGDSNGAPNGFDTKQWSNGSHEFKAVATDASGKTITLRETITVRN